MHDSFDSIRFRFIRLSIIRKTNKGVVVSGCTATLSLEHFNTKMTVTHSSFSTGGTYFPHNFSYEESALQVTSNYFCKSLPR